MGNNPSNPSLPQVVENDESPSEPSILHDEQYKLLIGRGTLASSEGSDIAGDESLFTPSFINSRFQSKPFSAANHEEEEQTIPEIKRRMRTAVSQDIMLELEFDEEKEKEKKYSNSTNSKYSKNSNVSFSSIVFDKEDVVRDREKEKSGAFTRIGALTKGLFPHTPSLSSKKTAFLQEWKGPETLSEAQITAILPFCRIEEFQPNEGIFRQGDFADCVVIMGKGHALLEFKSETKSKTKTKKSQKKTKFEIHKFAGDFFGQDAALCFQRDWRGTSKTQEMVLDKLLSETKRVCSAKSVSHCECVFLNISEIVEKLGFPILRTIDFVLGGGTIPSFLEKTLLFSSLKKYGNTQFSENPFLSMMFSFQRLKTGQVLFEAGSAGQDLFVVRKGVLGVYMDENEDEQSAKMEVTMTKGATCGEIALLFDCPRGASVVSKCDTVLMRLSFPEFVCLQESFTEIASNISEIARRHVFSGLKKFQIPFFEKFTEIQLRSLCALSRIVQIPGGETIFDEGEEGNCFYILISGKVGFFVHKGDGSLEISRIGPGRYFGEMALIKGDGKSKRLAKAQAITKCVLLSIQKCKFDAFFERFPQALDYFQTQMSNYRLTLEDVLIHFKGREFFHRYCKSEFNQENLKFWIAASKFERMARSRNRDRGELFLSFQELYCDYVSREADHPINLPSDMIRRLTAISIADVSPDVFTEAKEEIFKLMRDDVFRRFRSSPLFQDLLSHLSVYDTKILHSRASSSD